ncbi:ABC transporter ATP-binding protein [Aquibacillus kalidii]|uniref:ABC transporter ATP-binding protein n=1 Tax=Aquibacillus kalidii TaxID=2762597 RepID=UPI001648C24F|nr:phosphate ABC transporter ATP-binding protein [Aquibacillus kalidii]
MTRQAISLKDISYSDKGVAILKNISGSFPEGYITTLVGPSGAGKTTLFRLCNGLRSPNSGQIYINDKTINEYNPVELRRKVGIALQSAAMINGTILQNLSLPFDLQGKQFSKEFALELLQDVGLTSDFLHRDVKDLSGGQRQKLSIARTLVNRPDILLLDEITSSLDRVSQQDIEELIVKINKKYKTTIIWITHNLEQARTLGNYTWVMMNGQLVEAGPPSLLDDPIDEKVRLFVKGHEQ